MPGLFNAADLFGNLVIPQDFKAEEASVTSPTVNESGQITGSSPLHGYATLGNAQQTAGILGGTVATEAMSGPYRPSSPQYGISFGAGTPHNLGAYEAAKTLEFGGSGRAHEDPRLAATTKDSAADIAARLRADMGNPMGIRMGQQPQAQAQSQQQQQTARPPAAPARPLNTPAPVRPQQQQQGQTSVRQDSGGGISRQGGSSRANTSGMRRITYTPRAPTRSTQPRMMGGY